MSRVLVALLGLSLLAGGSDTMDAQVARPRANRATRAAGSAQAPARRQQLEQQLRRRMYRVTKDRVGLTDAQMTRLTETSERFDARRRSINQAERMQRQTLRTQILAGDKANQATVSAALDKLHQLQRQRLDLQVEEEKEFATFMTPLQRAKYAALQEQVRRRVESLRRQRPDSGGALMP